MAEKPKTRGTQVIIQTLRVAEGGVGVVVSANKAVQTSLFVNPGKLNVVSPDLEQVYEPPAHLKNYVQRRLGIANARREYGDNRWAELDHDSWRESLRQHEVKYDDYIEEEVLREFVATASTTAQLWVVQGEPGSGKSSLVERWMERWTVGLVAEFERQKTWWSAVFRIPRATPLLPILVRFRDLPAREPEETGAALAAFLWSYASHASREPRGFQNRLPGRRRPCVPVWFLDGWDEARADWYRSDAFLRRLAGIPGPKLLTCRTAVLAALQQATDLDNHIQASRLYTIRDLSPKEQLNFIVGRSSSRHGRAEKLHSMLQKHSQMRTVSSNPLLLDVIIDLVDTAFESASEFCLPQSRIAFYRAAVEHLWSRKLQGLGAGAEDALLRDTVLTELAGRVGLKKIAIENHALFETMRSIDDLQTKEQRERLLGFLVKSGLLVSPKTGVHQFVHLTFHEYFLALAWRSKALRECLDAYWAEPRYDETLALVVAQLVEDGESSQVECVLSEFVDWGQRQYDNEPELLLKIVKRSPFRVAINLVNRAGIGARDVPALMTLFAKKASSTEILAEAVGADSNTPPQLLEELAKSNALNWEAVAGNPNASEKVLRELAQSDDVYVRAQVASNPNTPEETLRLLATDADYFVRSGVGQNPRAPEAVLAELAMDDKSYVWERVIGNANAAVETLRTLASRQDASSYKLAGFLWNPSTPADVLRMLARYGITKRSRKTIHDPYESEEDPEVLRELAADERSFLRRAVAANLNAPEDVLRRLAKDADGHVRAALVYNPNVHADSLSELAEDGSTHVQLGVARHANTPAHALTKLAASHDPLVRSDAARHQRIILESLVGGLAPIL
jgi:Leucine rich repeat variant